MRGCSDLPAVPLIVLAVTDTARLVVSSKVTEPSPSPTVTLAGLMLTTGPAETRSHDLHMMSGDPSTHNHKTPPQSHCEYSANT